MQRMRRQDCYDTLRTYLKKTKREDPAVNNRELAKKLSENRVEGEKRLAAVFEKYSKKQDEVKEDVNQDEDSVVSEDDDEEEEEEEKESITDDESKFKDDLFAISSDSENSASEADETKTDKKVKIELEKNKENDANANKGVNKNIPFSDQIAVTADRQAAHRDVPNEVAVTVLQRDMKKTLKIISVEDKCDVMVSKVGDRTAIVKKVQKPRTRDVERAFKVISERCDATIPEVEDETAVVQKKVQEPYARDAAGVERAPLKIVAAEERCDVMISKVEDETAVVQKKIQEPCARDAAAVERAPLKIVAAEEKCDLMISKVGDKTAVVKKVQEPCTRDAAAVERAPDPTLTAIPSAPDRTNNIKTEGLLI